VKALIKLRRSNVCLNDGDMHHLLVSTDDERRTLVMERDEARVLINFGDMPYTFALLQGETLELISREGPGVRDNQLDLPPMTLAVLMSASEEVQNRQVAPHRR
jgi:maltooligosyltrehalose trehalohydrolase